VLQKLGLLWCFEIDYPTEKDPEERKVEIVSAVYRKAAEKCDSTAAICGCCTINGPTAAVGSHNDEIDPSTSLFDPMTKFYRHLELPGPEHGCGKCCTVHGPNPDASNDNILFAPVEAALTNCCGDLTCCARGDQSTTHSSTRGIVRMQPTHNPMFDTSNNSDGLTPPMLEADNDYLEVGGTTGESNEEAIQSKSSGTHPAFKASDIGEAEAPVETAGGTANERFDGFGDATTGRATSAPAPAPTPAPTEHTGFPEGFAVGKRCSVDGIACKGVIRFLGPLVETDKLRVGIELDEPLGKHNGTPKGADAAYFVCRKKHGLLTPSGKVQIENGDETLEGGATAPTSSSSSNSTSATSKCAQMTSSGPCEHDALAGAALCSDHTCMHPDCSSRKSSKDEFCKQHTMPASAQMTVESGGGGGGGIDL
jgi:hypothetical protein